MSLVFWYFNKKLIFGFKVKNIYIYLFHVYWILSIYNMLQSCFNIMFLYLYKFIEKPYFPLEVWFLENTGFWFKTNFQSHKNGLNCLKYVLNFCHTYLYFKDLI